LSRIAIMPARGGSKRIERKNAVEFFGRPLLTYALEAARESGLFDVIHVSTEDPLIAQIAAEWGSRPEFLRDPALADDMTPIMPVLKWALERFAERGRTFDSVAMLMPTAALIDADEIRGASALFDAHGGRFGVLAVASMPCPVEWAMRVGSDRRIVMIDPANAYTRSQDLEPAYYDSGTIAVFPAGKVLGYPAAQTEFLGYVIPRYKAVDIDNAEDFELAKRLFRGRPNE
jgi:pseudaminic acid cytidylyltransferase